MTRIVSFDLFAVDLPFRRPFRHSAACRYTSDSIFLKCTTDSGAVGYGECLPRSYVTGESRDSTYLLLLDVILPRLVGKKFESYPAVEAFLHDCNGRAPVEWVRPGVPQTAAWCAVDLALLDTFGHEFGRPVFHSDGINPLPYVRYSGVLQSDSGLKLVKSCVLFRLFGFRQVKMKVGWDGDIAAIRTVRRILGPKVDIRVDANMAWNFEQALRTMREMSLWGVRCFEQPVAADALDEMSELVRETGFTVMADESFSHPDSLLALVEKGACNAVNVRISKCGGLIASLRCCQEAHRAALTIQVGCQVGESSLLSVAQQALLAQVRAVLYAEGCFGRYLLREDVAEPLLQFGYAGRPPKTPTGPGLGVTIDETRLRRWTVRSDRIAAD